MPKGILPTDEFSPVLGDTFLRSAYVVYHLGNNEISIAPTIFNATDSDIREINNGTDGVPDATVVAGAVSTGAGLGGGARADDTPGFNSDFEDDLDTDDSNDESDESDDAVETVTPAGSSSSDEEDDFDDSNIFADDPDDFDLEDDLVDAAHKIGSVLANTVTTGLMVVVVVHTGMAWLA